MKNLENLGKRIAIIGPSSSGKSTLADSLGKALNIPNITHMDLLAHIPNTNWERKPIEETIADHNKVVAQDEWIIEGNYSVCMNERFARATHIIWLDYSPLYCVYNFIKRRYSSKTNRKGKVEGAPEKLRLAPIKRLLTVYPKDRIKYKGIISNYSDTPITYIHSMRELDKFRKINNLKR